MAPSDDSKGWLAAILKDAIPIVSSPHLEPEDSPFADPVISGYYRFISRSVVEPGHDELDSIARESLHPEIASVLCLPTYEPAWALWVVGESKFGFSILSTEPGFRRRNPSMPSAQFAQWLDEEQNSESPFSIPIVPATKYVNPLAADLAADVCDVWRRVVSQTRYPDDTLIAGCDGVTYHFGYRRKGFRPIAGQTWSPSEQTVPGKLVALSHALRDYVRSAQPSDRQLAPKIAELLVRIWARCGDLQKDL